MNTGITLDPEIVAWPIIYKIEALFELYKLGRLNPANTIFSAKIDLFSSGLEEKKIEKLGLNTAITLDPEIVAGPIIYKIEALFELYKLGWVNPANAIFSAKIHLFSSDLEAKKSKNCA